MYSRFHCFLLSLFSIFSQFLDIYSCFIYFTSPIISNVSLIYVVTNFVMNFWNIFPHMVLGIGKKKATLKPDAIPTLFTKPVTPKRKPEMDQPHERRGGLHMRSVNARE